MLIVQVRLLHARGYWPADCRSVDEFVYSVYLKPAEFSCIAHNHWSALFPAILDTRYFFADARW